MEKKEFKIEDHTPEDALTLLGNYAMSARIEGTLGESQHIIAALQAAHKTIAMILEGNKTITEDKFLPESEK